MPTNDEHRFVYEFDEGDRNQRDLLGGKGANLAEMTNLGLPVPPGFTVTTEACRAYLARGDEPPGLREEIDDHLRRLEEARGKRLGDAEDPLLVSVRSGAKFSMPGMMDTVLDVGLTETSVPGLAKATGSERFAWDSYRRLIQMFGTTVLGIEATGFEHALEEAKREAGAETDVDLGVDRLKGLVDTYKGIVRREAGRGFPQDPAEQLDLAVRAVFDSWNTDRARVYRRRERIPDDLGTAVNVMSMVFGNLGPDSGTGVAFTRDPATGAQGVWGDYLPNAQGEDVVAGIRDPVPLADLERIDPASYRDLLEVMATLEGHYKDLCDVEFTIERGKLWMLQTRVGKRTAAAAFLLAAEFLDQGFIDEDEALRRVTGAQLAQLMFPQFDERARPEAIATGVPASPGAAVGEAVFDSSTAAEHSEPVILVRRETNPDDLQGMIAAAGILTSRGGKTSHAAVVARGMGKTCVVGTDGLEVDYEGRRFTAPDGTVIREGDTISIDGTTGSVYSGAVAVAPSSVVEFFEGHLEKDEGGTVVAAVARMMDLADRRRRLGVHANADAGPDAERARRFGAEGIGLCRTEHMFLGERRRSIEELILAESAADQEKALAELLPLQLEDFAAVFAAMDGLPVTVRLIDPPLHEFLPDLTDLSVRVALAEERGEVDEVEARLLEAVRRLDEQNPMLGLRGVRLGLVVPGLVTMQVRAIAEAAASRIRAGGDPHPEVMVPLIGSVREFELMRAEIERVVAEVSESTGVAVPVKIGTMIELPRAALTAGPIAESAAFFSFGTNDLTQTVWGFSRDDVEGSFFSAYMDLGIFQVSPFESLDEEGVGRLVSIAVEEGRAARDDLIVGVCGEHGGDPASVRFFDRVGLDYVSCSPFRVPVARLEAGRAALPGEDEDAAR